MKIIKILNCIDCPFFTIEQPEINISGGCYCEKYDFKKITSWVTYVNDLKFEIPKWCPLENA